MVNKYPLISHSKAYELVNSNEWAFDTTISESVKNNAIKKAAEIRQLGIDKRGDLQTIEEIFREAINVNSDFFERYDIRLPPVDPKFMQLRISQYCVYKVSTTTKEAFFKMLGVVVAVLSFTDLKDYLKAGLAIREFVKTIMSGWERLTNPNEQQVFEAVFTLQGKLSVGNYQALKLDDYEQAYELISPTNMNLIEYCKESMPEEVVFKTLEDLKKRNVLVEKNGRWSIIF